VLLPGDGIGVEVVAEGRRILERVADLHGHTFEFDEQLIGGGSIDRHGTALTEDALAACRNCDAVLLGAVGAPKYDDPRNAVRPEQASSRCERASASLPIFDRSRSTRRWSMHRRSGRNGSRASISSWCAS
jgi:isocitrate/isopropylmalate dehydrogenase